MNYQIEFRHLLYFKTVAEELHFRKAAERLFITQPGLTRQIKQLEELYKVQLFERGNRFVRLTKAGEFLKNEVDLLFNHLTAIENQLTKINEGKLAELKLGFIGSAVQLILPQLLASLKKEYPNIDINLQELSNEAQLNLIHKNELDFGFVRNYLPFEELSYINLSEENFALVVPQNYVYDTTKPINIADFKKKPFILFSKDYSSSYYNLVMSIFSDHGFKPSIALRTVNALTIFNLVEQGLGVAIVPSSLKKGYNLQVKFIELKNIPQRTTISLVWSDKNRNPGVPLLINHIKQIL
jgi:DNA-binding transcriptional LysR family regulator